MLGSLFLAYNKFCFEREKKNYYRQEIMTPTFLGMGFFLVVFASLNPL